MKTRQEMIYDFMLALAPNWTEMCNDLLINQEFVEASHVAEEIIECASALADAYLEQLS